MTRVRIMGGLMTAGVGVGVAMGMILIGVRTMCMGVICTTTVAWVGAGDGVCVGGNGEGV